MTMLFKNHTYFICFYIQLWVWTMLHVETTKVKSCEFRLSGQGHKRYEGFIEVKNKTGEWNNVCGTIDDVETYGVDMCSKLTLNSGEPVVRYPKVSNESLQEYAIRVDDDCDFNKTENPCQIGRDKNCCHPIWICCPNVALAEKCSGNWSEILNASCYAKNEGKRTSYAEARDKPFHKEEMKNKALAWTTSALVGDFEGNCTSDKTISRDRVWNCSSLCLNSDNFTKVHIFSGGDCRCNDRLLIHRNESECNKVLKVVNNKDEHAELCIAAEVKNGITTFMAEDCDRLLQPFCAKFKDEQKDQPERTSLKPLEEESEDVLVPSIIVFVTITVAVVLTAVICRCCRKKARKEPLPHNVMYNRTYDRQMRKSDEEYAIISEIELDSGVSVYKPPLPERSTSSPDGNTYSIINYKQNIETNAVITLDDYSTPSDVIKDTTDFDLAAEYSTTYDDPIRHNADNEENAADDKQLSETNHDKRSSQYSTFQQKNASSKSYECLTGAKIVAGNFKNCTESDEIKDCDKLGANGISDTNHSQHSTTALTQRSMKKTDDNFETFTPSTISETKTAEQSNDYEDTNVIDGNFPTKPTKGITEEHICLHCLKPEHLKKLGIKLIPDKNLDDSEKRFSEPFRKVDADVTEPNRKLRRCKTDVTETDAQCNLITLKGTFRQCVECQNVYDHLGNFKEADDVNSNRNEYHHIGTVEKEKNEKI